MLSHRIRHGALAAMVLAACTARGGAPAPAGEPAAADAAAFWNSATVYFLLTDRFANGDTGNDRALGRQPDAAMLRGFMGGDLAGIRRKLEEGWFDSLGVTAIWLTPFVEQIAGPVDEGTGRTYGFHGYWTRDWTAVDPALGTMDDLRGVVDAAHRRGIRVLMDAVLNHTGPAVPTDPVWPADWVRTSPQCTYRSYATTTDCTLVANLPDLLTERDEPVELPPFLVEKWRREGRLEREQAELNAFFQRTGYPRAPRYYVIKWLTDWVRELGFDGYRVDTAKHFPELVSAALKREAALAFEEWKNRHQALVIDSLPFYMMGEVYGYELSHGRAYDFGDRSVDFFNFGYDGLINFGFKRDAAGPLDAVFSRYAAALTSGPLRGVSVINYVSSHDDGSPLDADRRDPMGAGTRLLLAPGGAQIYYGDETARPLRVAGADGDANLRSFMNWDDVTRGGATAEVLRHWRRLGQFRHAHPAVGAGVHGVLQDSPYVFSRVLRTAGRTDQVVVGLGLPEGAKAVPVRGVFREGTRLVDGYSGTAATVRNDTVSVSTPYPIVLLAQPVAARRSGRRIDVPVTVNVVNNSGFQMDVFASGSGIYYRLGTLPPGTSGTYTLRAAMVAGNSDVEFLAQVIGGGPRVTGGRVLVRPGDIVDFEVAVQPRNSRAIVRP